jgi:folate-dependent phosphoribosylglycinamide formyltransferase PurN
MKNCGYDVSWVEERRDDKKSLLIRRCKKQGLFKTVGQLSFLIFQKYLNFISKKRKKEITDGFGVISEFTAEYVTSNVNSLAAIKYISNYNADLIILSGTRILSAELLSNLDSPILNIHAGINPKYRGVHGGYWALVNEDEINCGATIHRVDEGVDTGEVLAYVKIKVTDKDNFVTYPILQQKAALTVIPQIIRDIFSGSSIKSHVVMESKIWSHPTIWQYFYYRFKLGIK